MCCKTRSKIATFTNRDKMANLFYHLFLILTISAQFKCSITCNSSALGPCNFYFSFISVKSENLGKFNPRYENF